MKDRARFVLTASCLTALGVAQSTTWTSFEDRRGHTMASTPTGGVVMFGGQSVTQPGVTLGDTNRLSTNNQTWTQGTDGIAPRSEHAMAATTLAAVTSYVVFGGLSETGVPTNTTYRYDGTAWGDLTPLSTLRPPDRSAHSLVANTLTHTLMMFGGFDGTNALNDVWEYDLGTLQWTPHGIYGTSPSPRYGHSMAFDPGTGGASGRFYVFGGSPFRNDLWEFDPYTDTWTQRTPASPPPGRRKAAMTYLSGQGELVLFGGLSSGGAVRNDTWSYDPGSNVWTQQTPTTPPPARYDHAMSADNSGNNLILLGGTNAAGDVLESTWAWSSVTFQWVEQLPSPADRNGVAMAYDSARNRHVVFGGRAVNGGQDLDETWEIDGLNWRRRAPSAKPSARSDAGMAHDRARNRTVLYGGRSQATGQDLGDTWEWNGTTWILMGPLSNPSAAGGTQPVFDSKRNVVWNLIGTDMWRYDGSAWTKAQVPSARWGAAAAYDEARGVATLFGGYGPTGPLNDTWEWDGAWHLRAPAVSPSARLLAAASHDASSGLVILFGGDATLAPATRLADTWTWNGTSWAQLVGGGPGARRESGLARAPQGGLLLFGGDLPGGAAGDSWRWSGGWTTISPPTSPSPRMNYQACYSPQSQRVVMFGGILQPGSSNSVDETWEYDGTTWIQRTPTLTPGRRIDGGCVYDGASHRVLVACGRTDDTAQSVSYTDTWAWDGSSWSQVSANHFRMLYGVSIQRPSRPMIGFGGSGSGDYNSLWEWGWDANSNQGTWSIADAGSIAQRTNYGAAYDARRDCVVVFGGMTANSRASATYNQETWEWNGSRWVQRNPAVRPSARGWCKLAYDEARARVVLYGGADATNVFDDTWEWDGTNWILQTPVASPPGSYGHDLTYDAARRLTIAYGGLGTWDYGPVVAAGAVSFAPGCPTSAGGPLTLAPLPWAGPWLGERFETDFVNQPLLSVGIAVWGFSNTVSAFGPLPFQLAMFGSPSCYLRTDAVLTELILPPATRYTSFLLPNHPSFLGAKMFLQSGFFDVGLPGTPVVTSNGLELTFGQK